MKPVMGVETPFTRNLLIKYKIPGGWSPLRMEKWTGTGVNGILNRFKTKQKVAITFPRRHGFILVSISNPVSSISRVLDILTGVS